MPDNVTSRGSARRPIGLQFSLAFLVGLVLVMGAAFGLWRALFPPLREGPTTTVTISASAGGTRPDYGSKEYPLKGVVKTVEADQGRVVVKHELIPGYMAPMTMPFRVADPILLDGLVPGDEFEGTLRVSADDAEITDLTVIRPATAAPIGIGAPGLKPTQVLEPGQPVPDFRVTTQEGKPLSLSDLRGKVVVLTFIYTRCPLPTACPLLDKKFAELAAQVRGVSGWAEKVRLLSVSFDPEHDTPEALARHANLKGAAPPLWTFAVAEHEELNRVAGPLGLAYGPGDGEIIHSMNTAVIAPDGTLARIERRADWPPAELLKAIKPLVPADSP